MNFFNSMSNFIVKCNQCNGEIDVKTKARLDKIKKQSYLCKICIIENKSRICPDASQVIGKSK
jgi:transposase-like protein